MASRWGHHCHQIIADLILQDLEKKALNLIEMELLLYYRYVDDIIIAAPINKVSYILRHVQHFPWSFPWSKIYNRIGG